MQRRDSRGESGEETARLAPCQKAKTASASENSAQGVRTKSETRISFSASGRPSEGGGDAESRVRWGCCVSAFRETALHVLGGEAAASQALSASPPERLVLSFKGGSERPFGSSVASTALPAAGLVLKRRVFKSGREEWSVLGRLRQTHVFEGVADFYFIPPDGCRSASVAHSDVVAEAELACKERDPLSASSAARSPQSSRRNCYLPPPAFCRLHPTATYRIEPPPSTQTTPLKRRAVVSSGSAEKTFPLETTAENAASSPPRDAPQGAEREEPEREEPEREEGDGGGDAAERSLLLFSQRAAGVLHGRSVRLVAGVPSPAVREAGSEGNFRKPRFAPRLDAAEASASPGKAAPVLSATEASREAGEKVCQLEKDATPSEGAPLAALSLSPEKQSRLPLEETKDRDGEAKEEASVQSPRQEQRPTASEGANILEEPVDLATSSRLREEVAACASSESKGLGGGNSEEVGAFNLVARVSDEKLPSAPPPAAAKAFADPELLSLLTELLNKQPIWIRSTLDAKLPPAFSAWRKKPAFAKTCFLFADGPWRGCLCRLGYDPRTDPESRLLQTIDFRDPFFRSINWKAAAASGAAPHHSLQERGEEGLKSRPNEVYQLCAIEDPAIKKLLQEAPVAPTFSKDTGWFSRETLKTLRELMVLKSKRMRGAEEEPPVGSG